MFGQKLKNVIDIKNSQNVILIDGAILSELEKEGCYGYK